MIAYYEAPHDVGVALLKSRPVQNPSGFPPSTTGAQRLKQKLNGANFPKTLFFVLTELRTGRTAPSERACSFENKDARGQDPGLAPGLLQTRKGVSEEGGEAPCHCCFHFVDRSTR